MNTIEKSLDFVQKAIFKGIIITFLILVISQIILLIPGMGIHLNTALRIEGEPLKDEMLLSQAGNISPTPWTSLTLKLMDYASRPDVEIRVNGKDTGNFLRNTISLSVNNRDIITIFNPKENLPVKIIVSNKTSNILSPELNAKTEGSGRLYFDTVVIK